MSVGWGELPNEVLLPILEQVPQVHKLWRVSKRFFLLIQDIVKRALAALDLKSVFTINKHNNTPLVSLLHACSQEEGVDPKVEGKALLMLKAGANPNGAKGGVTPLTCMVFQIASDPNFQRFQLKMIRLLRKWGADPTIECYRDSKWKISPLKYAETYYPLAAKAMTETLK